MQLYLNKNNFCFKARQVLENKLLLLASLFLFILPLMPLNQLITGTIVNAILIKYAVTFNSKKVYLLSIIPSTAVLLGGVLFSNLTLQIAFMLPFIWGANFALMLLTKRLFVEKKKEYFVSTTVSSITKTIILFLSAGILFYLEIVPATFLVMFGLMQFITAECGAVMVYLLKDYF